MKFKFHALVAVIAVASSVLGCGSEKSIPVETAGPDEPGYVIEGSAIQFDNGVFLDEDGTVSLLESVRGDLNNDEVDDLVATLRLDSRGTGIFYYLNVFTTDDDGQLSLVGEEFLGDRIKLDFIKIYREGSLAPGTDVPIHPDDYGQLVVGYSIHADDQSFADEPALYITRHWRVSGGELLLLENY